LRGGHACTLGPLAEPACEEGLAGAVLASDGVEGRTALRDGSQLIVHRGSKAAQPDRKQIQSRLRHRPTAQRIDHLPAADCTDRLIHEAPRPNCARSMATSSRTLLPPSTLDSTG